MKSLIGRLFGPQLIRFVSWRIGMPVRVTRADYRELHKQWLENPFLRTDSAFKIFIHEWIENRYKNTGVTSIQT